MQTKQVEEIKSLMGDYTIIDVREQSEFDDGYIEGATHLALSGIDGNELPSSTKPYLVYCLRGGRSAQAIMYWQDKYPEKQFINLEGGISAWLATGLSLTVAE